METKAFKYMQVLFIFRQNSAFKLAKGRFHKEHILVLDWEVQNSIENLWNEGWIGIRDAWYSILPDFSQRILIQ